MELLVVGATGYIGNAIYNEAKSRNIKVIGTKHQKSGVDLMKFDILSDKIGECDKNFISDEKCAVICSAIPKIDKCYRDYEYAYDVNVTSTIRLLDSLNVMGYKTVFFSSDMVFDGLDGYYDETAKPVPLNKYGAMKFEVEEYMLRNLTNACIMRISKIIGDKPNTSNVFTEWHNLSIQGKNIPCIKGNIFSPTDINDIVNCLFIVFERNLSGLYNVCNDEHFERIELAYQFTKILNLKAELINKPVEHFNFEDARPLKTYMCNDKFKKETDYNFRSVKDILNKYKENSLESEEVS